MFLKRLIVGLVLGLVVGGIAGVALVQGLGASFVETGGAVLAYVSAAATGVLTGLVAGKPIWAADGKIEAGLKAFFGALLSLGAMFAIRQWLSPALPEIHLEAFNAGHGLIGDLPVVALPMIAALLGGFFELDNTGDGDEKKEGKGSKAEGTAKEKASAKKVRVEEEADEEDEPVSEKKAKR